MAIYDLVIVGAGPAGLAAAIAAKRTGLKFRILEKGALVNSIFRFPSQMVFFNDPGFARNRRFAVCYTAR